MKNSCDRTWGNFTRLARADTSHLYRLCLTALYRITQEALNNVIKHANPSQASVTLTVRSGSATLIVSDDGCGFDLGEVSPDHFGLSIMKERAASIDATADLSQIP